MENVYCLIYYEQKSDVCVSISHVSSHNQLSALPVELCSLQNLRVLTVQQNQLESLPEELGQLKNLTELVTEPLPSQMLCTVLSEWLTVSCVSLIG